MSHPRPIVPSVDSCDDCCHPPPVPSPVALVPPGQRMPIWLGTAYQLNGAEKSLGVPAQLQLIWRRSFTLELTLTDPPWQWWPDDAAHRPVMVGFEFNGATSELPISRLSEESGWCNGSVLRNRAASSHEVIAALTNQPRIFGGAVHDHVSGATWSGHWPTVIDGWLITIDALPNLTDNFRISEREQTYALTHTLRVSREDAAPFDYAAASNIMYALQVALSFAAGYWVGLICPTGHDENGNVTWMQVGPPHNGRACRGGAWFNDTRPQDLDELLGKLLPLWKDPVPTDPLLRDNGIDPFARHRVCGTAHHHRAVGAGDAVVEQRRRRRRDERQEVAW